MEEKIFNENISLSFHDKIPFGIELEFANASLINIYTKIKKLGILKNIYKDGWNVMQDIHLTQKNTYGGEVASPILYNKKEDLQQMKKILTILKEEKARADEKASLQVSIDLSIFEKNPIYLQRFLTLWSLFEPEIYTFCYGTFNKPRTMAHKRAMPFGNYIMNYLISKRISSINEVISDLESLFKTKAFGLYIEKEEGGNGKNRIEFRPSNSTLQQTVILNTINFYVHLINSVKDEKNWIEILKYTKNYYDERIKPYMDVFLFHPQYGKYQEQIFSSSSDFTKANFLANHIFQKEEEKNLFLKQYTKQF